MRHLIDSLEESLVKNIGLGPSAININIVSTALKNRQGKKLVEDFVENNGFEVFYDAKKWLPGFVDDVEIRAEAADRSIDTIEEPAIVCMVYPVRYIEKFLGYNQRYIIQTRLIAIESDRLEVIADVPELKDVYKALDGAFSKHTKESNDENGKSNINPLNYFVYKWKDSKTILFNNIENYQ